MRSDLRRHIERTGNKVSVTEDAATNLTMQFTSGVLDVVEQALRTEDIESDVIRRVLDLIIFGAVPNRGEVAFRQDLLERLTDVEMGTIRSALVVRSPEEVETAMRRLQGLSPKVTDPKDPR